MSTTVTATQVRNEISQIINKVFYQGEEFIVEKQGKPVARITGYQQIIRKPITQEFAPPVYDMGGTKKVYTREDVYE